ncbi:MAG TPA: hypothetical protein EYN69_09140 [Flavobacteriales bacterium]|nr:hypothetical protein [Flavobacteriales bacterium]
MLSLVIISPIIISTALGAISVEKHICLDRALKGIDHESSISLDYFKKLIKQVRMVEKALGSEQEQPFSEGEIRYRNFMKRVLTNG